MELFTDFPDLIESKGLLADANHCSKVDMEVHQHF